MPFLTQIIGRGPNARGGVEIIAER